MRVQCSTHNIAQCTRSGALLPHTSPSHTSPSHTSPSHTSPSHTSPSHCQVHSVDQAKVVKVVPTPNNGSSELVPLIRQKVWNGDHIHKFSVCPYIATGTIHCCGRLNSSPPLPSLPSPAAQGDKAAADLVHVPEDKVHSGEWCLPAPKIPRRSPFL